MRNTLEWLFVISLVFLAVGLFSLGRHRQHQFDARERLEPYEITKYEQRPIPKIHTITAYCACVKCCGRWADGVTASGTKPVQGRTAAMNGVPFGTILHIPEVGWRVVEDRMAMRYSDRIDIYFDSHEDALQFGIKTNYQVTYE
jgi:3D (Asp-Asp-Asp) domain-containing protein